MTDTFNLDYWKVAGALCRALEEHRDDPVFNAIVIELDKQYPQFDWANTLTDSWPLDERAKKGLEQMKRGEYLTADEVFGKDER